MIISPTMKALDTKKLKPVYAVLKLGSEVFSTDFLDFTGKDFVLAEAQLVETKGIGLQNNIHIKGFFIEKEKHESIEPVPFEINIYIEV